MRISDWSSDVCSSDLEAARLLLQHLILEAQLVKTGLHRPRADCPGSYGLPCGLSCLLCLACQLFRVLLVEILEACHPCTCLSFQWLLAKHAMRSEEHTSELQSLMRISSAVFCLKKKKKIKNNQTHTV